MHRYFAIIFSTVVLVLVVAGIVYSTITADFSPIVPLCLAAMAVLPLPFLRTPYFFGTGARRYVQRLVLILTPLLLFIAIIFALTDGSMAAIIVSLIPVAVVAFLVLVFRSSRYVRRRRDMVVIAYLEQAMRLNLPLPRMLTAAQQSESGPIARRLAEVKKQIEAGATVTDSLRKSTYDLPPRAMGLIAAGERIARLPQALDHLIREDRSGEGRHAVQRAFFSVYPIVMSLAIFLIVSMIMIFVMPKFEQIFKDFKTPLPDLTEFLIQVSNFVTSNFILLLMLAVLFAISVLIPDRYRPSIRWPRFGFGGWGLNRDLADATNVVADSLSAGLPLDAALRNAGELPVSSRLRWKLYRWAGGIEQGMPTADAPRRAGLPNLIVGLSATGDLAAAEDAFRFLARYYSAKFSRLVQLARGAAVPAMVLFFAVIVGTVELGLFLPMIRLIQAVSPYQQHL